MQIRDRAVLLDRKAALPRSARFVYRLGYYSERGTMSNRSRALVAGIFIVMAAGGESYADQIHLTCKSRVVQDPGLSLLVNLDYAANTAVVAKLSDLKPMPDRYGKTASPIQVTNTHVSWRRDVDSGQVQKVFYTLSRVDGSLSVVPAEANSNVIMDAPPGSWSCIPGPMPKADKPKTIF
jgi:hypothetical protein